MTANLYTDNIICVLSTTIYVKNTCARARDNDKNALQYHARIITQLINNYCNK